ncbi:MAG: DUF3108 domain-containing protein [Hydrotalea sp.]|nr:DUF3108 domain-containing protein [Hydrotalea sp.]
MKRILSFLFTLIMFSPLMAGNDFCGTRNQAYVNGEQVNFTVYYNVIGLYVNAGNAVFTVEKTQFQQKPAYHIVGVGVSNSRYDWIFKVRDRYESYIDTATLKPYRFARKVEEGGYKFEEEATFQRDQKIVKSSKGTFQVPDCVHDILSAVYYARNIDYNNYEPEDKIPFSIYLDGEVHNMHIRYLGKETIKTKYGKFRAIKFKPLLLKGTIFEGGENMTVWVSDDANRIPLRVESPIVVGSVKIDMMDCKNIRYPLSSLISKR